MNDAKTEARLHKLILKQDTVGNLRRTKESILHLREKSGGVARKKSNKIHNRQYLMRERLWNQWHNTKVRRRLLPSGLNGEVWQPRCWYLHRLLGSGKRKQGYETDTNQSLRR